MRHFSSLAGKNALIVISGGIAAYKTLDLIRRLREQDMKVRCILTKGGQQFVTPLAAAALSENKVYTDLFSLTDEQEMGHIRLVREADIIIVAPASANLIAKLAHGIADDLASTALLAATRPILAVPAMNTAMWSHAATQENLAILKRRGLHILEPDSGTLACGEHGAGRMPETHVIMEMAAKILEIPGPLNGKHAIVTSGPTREPLDPVRFISNRSSGKQGHAIAAALAKLGACVTLISGPVSIPVPDGVKFVTVETAMQMLSACEAALPADIFIGCAAVADWRAAETQAQKMKKTGGLPMLKLEANPDILATIASHARRPALVVGFAAESENLRANAAEKLAQKNCDWLLANDIADGSIFGGDENQLLVLRRSATGAVAIEDWPRQSKTAHAARLADAVGDFFKGQNS